jgi:hypothetical protein
MKRLTLAGVIVLLLPLLVLPVLAAVARSTRSDNPVCDPPSPMTGPRLPASAIWPAARRPGSPWTTHSSGAYLSQARAAVDQQTAAPRPVCRDTSSAAPATAFTGRSDGCTMPDPFGTGGCVTRALATLIHQVEQRFGHLPGGCWSARSGDPYSDHPTGKACDYTFGRIGTYPGPDDVQRGWTLATWLRANAIPLQVNYVIWQGRIWSRTHDAEGWRAYTGGGHYSASGPTNGHYDHVHVSTVE